MMLKVVVYIDIDTTDTDIDDLQEEIASEVNRTIHKNWEGVEVEPVDS